VTLQRVTFDIAGENQYARAFEAGAREVTDMSEPLEEVGESLRLSVSEQFRTEGAHGLGSKWKPLNDSYARWKEQQVGPQPMLVFTGDMRDSMLDRQAITVTPQRMVYAPRHPDYAPRHQKGEGQLPQRKMVAVPMSVRRQWDRYFAEWLNGIRRGIMRGRPA
jgi:hypothetical protein